jgi:hypothetical protein
MKLSGREGGFRNLSATNNKFIQEEKGGQNRADHWRAEKKAGENPAKSMARSGATRRVLF